VSTRPARLHFRDLRLILLAVATGATDATTFERLGHIFASVITGNLVLLGIGAARGDGRLALLSGVGLTGYALGVLVAAPRGEPAGTGAVWPAGATLALSADLACLVVFAVGWELAGGHPGETAAALLLAAAAAAMGMQSTAVRRLGELSTTYLTSTLTGLLEAFVSRQWSSAQQRSVGILVMALAGAAGATGLIVLAWRLVPVLQLVPLAIVIGVSRPLSAVAGSP
jgi:uncharacterized membrane protein YoaK (UPF0700 family)